MTRLRWLVGAALLGTAAWATTIVPHTLLERARESDRIVLGQILGSRVEMTGGDPRSLRTVVSVAVGRDLKGQGEAHLTVTQVGGDYAGWSVHVPGDAEFRTGEVALLFLKCGRSTADCGLVALGEGKIAIEGDVAIVHDLFTKQWARRPLKDVLAELQGAKPEVRR